ncbi:MAG: alanine:cation symporter family protein [Deltaproteobacteria bacterium]|nr:MAG: alanine:cation symporter family protein [Deltaproteobacteria bacterium]
MVGTLGTDEKGNTIVVAGTEEVSTGHTGKALIHADGTPVTRSVPFVVVWLIFGAIFFTIRMGFINLRGFRHALDLVRGKYDDPNEPGEVSHFKALATALSATVGLGNIAGVAVAISIGGPGATFWMIVAGLLGMSSKFVECTLGVKYRTIDAKGHVSGGPMYYLSRALEGRGLGGLGKTLAVLFAILCVGGSLGGGNMFQANQALEGLVSQFPALASDSAGPIFGFVLAFLVGLVIIGGIQSIARVTSFIVPFMCGTYVIAAIVIILMNIDQVGDVFVHIFAGAFGADALKGGFIGVLIAGFQRAAFSNEAGIGSASIAHSAAKTDEPISEGVVALLEPFIDTVVVCTMTASVIIFSGAYKQPGLSGASLTSEAFGHAISWFPYILTMAILLFAFSTMISWSYYGLKAWTFLFGGSATADLVYKVLFLFCVILGSSVKLGAVLDFSDMMILGMAFPNILGLLILSGEVRRDLDSYWQRIVRGGGAKEEAVARATQDAA